MNSELNTDIFEIDSDIRSASTLRSEFYLDESCFEVSKEKIFSRSWQFVGVAGEVENLAPHDLFPGFIDEPIILTRDEVGDFHCFSNVCTHRGKILLDRPVQADAIRCPYHGRCFSLDGRFRSMPEFEGVKGFPSKKDDLAKIAFSVWNDLIFVSLNPSSSLNEFICEMKRIMMDFDFENLKIVSAKDYEINAHWALYCENYLEGFHIPFVHKGLNRELEYGNYTTETFRYSSLQTGFDESGEIAARYFFIFPNLMFNFYPWGVSINIVKPLRKSLTRVSYMTFVNDKSKVNEGAGADLETVEFEDQAVVESVQKGISSRFYDSGRYSPNREQGTHHFHRLISEFMMN